MILRYPSIFLIANLDHGNHTFSTEPEACATQWKKFHNKVRFVIRYRSGFGGPSRRSADAMVPAITRTPRSGGHIMPAKPTAALDRQRPPHRSQGALRGHRPLRHRLFCQLFPLLPPGHRGILTGLRPAARGDLQKRSGGLRPAHRRGLGPLPASQPSTAICCGSRPASRRSGPRPWCSASSSTRKPAGTLLAEGTATLVAIGAGLEGRGNCRRGLKPPFLMGNKT